MNKILYIWIKLVAKSTLIFPCLLFQNLKACNLPSIWPHYDQILGYPMDKFTTKEKKRKKKNCTRTKT